MELRSRRRSLAQQLRLQLRTAPRWNQQWRTPVARSARLAPRLHRSALRETRPLSSSKILWATRDDYIEVVLDRSQENMDQFLSRHASSPRRCRTVTLLKLLEIQRHEMLMYTSCGWFFDEISGIETVQVLQYAAAPSSWRRTSSADSPRVNISSERLAPRRTSEYPSKNGGVYERS